MALNDKATMVVTEGHYYAAPVGTPLPTDLTKITTPWEEIGHTEQDTPITITSDGGESSTLGTLQNAKLRTLRTAAVRSLEVNFAQFDEKALRYFVGKNAVLENGLLYEQDTVSPETGALLCVLRDGDHYVVIHARKFEATANGDFNAEDTENFTTYPVKFTALNEQGKQGALGISPVVDAKLKPVAPEAAAERG